MQLMKKFDLRFTSALPVTTIAAAFLLAAPMARAQDDGAMNDDGGTTTNGGTGNTQMPMRPVPATSFSNLLSGKSIPLKLQMKNLNNSFRRITAAGQSDVWSIQIQMMSAQAGIEFGVYYTQGQTVSMGDETYLIAYRQQSTIPADIWNHRGHGEAPPEAQKPGPNAMLTLSLLNLRTAGSLNDVRTFDPKLDISSAGEINVAAVRQLERLGQGILTYVRQRNGVMPKMTATMTPAARRVFYPAVHDQRLWVHPVTEQPFRPNPKMSEVRLANIKNAAQVVLFSEGVPAGDGTRAVLFADGHVVRVSPEQWTRIAAVAPIVKAPDTAAIAARVKSALLNTPSLNGSKIDVEVNGNTMTVRLRGTVRNDAQSILARSIARKTAPGYEAVSRLRITPPRRA